MQMGAQQPSHMMESFTPGAMAPAGTWGMGTLCASLFLAKWKRALVISALFR